MTLGAAKSDANTGGETEETKVALVQPLEEEFKSGFIGRNIGKILAAFGSISFATLALFYYKK